MDIIEELNKLIEKAIKKDCVPVGALIIKGNKIISKAHNIKEKTNNPLDHAEIVAIKKAAKKKKTWNLSDCKMYVTMKPCKMCESVILESRIKEVIYICQNEKENNKKSTVNYIKINDINYENKYKLVLKTFFKNKRK